MRARTYSHLRALGRKPNDYDIGTSKLLYYVDRGFEVTTPVTRWIDERQSGSPLRCSDWERFRDPRETTYAKYTEMQAAKEIFVDGLLRLADSSGRDRSLAPEWLRFLRRALAPLRYPVHGLSMLASYFAHIAPSGRIVVAGLFQAADEMRRTQRIAYRLRQLEDVDSEIHAGSRTTWETDPAWQPLRELIETALVTYDWGESFVATNLVIKPIVDDLFSTHLSSAGSAFGDDVLAKIAFSLNEDAEWHRQWSKALVETAVEDREENREVIERWIERWLPRARRATAAFVPAFDEISARTALRGTDVRDAVHRSHRDLLSSMGIEARRVTDEE